MNDENMPMPFAVFLEAVRDSDKGQQRTQWLLFPPACANLGAELDEGWGRFLKRKIEKAGHRAKWSDFTRRDFGEVSGKAVLEMEQYASTGWEVRAPIVILMDQDDYQLAMTADASVPTPYKALRHVEAVAKKRGYRLVG